MHMVARSLLEAKFKAMEYKTCEVLSLKIQLNELGYNAKDPMRLHYDKNALNP